MTDARREAIEKVADMREQVRGTDVSLQAVYKDAALEGWERAIVRGRLLERVLAAVAEIEIIGLGEISHEFAAEIRAELEGQGK